MSSRRRFLAQAAAAGSTLALGATLSDAKESASPSSTRLRVLILGATGNIGPYHVRAAVARGHHVSAFSRGRSAADLPEGVERLVGDRNGDLSSILHRDWDAVLDVATFGPGWVRTLGEALRGRVRHYTFISTISVYDKPEEHQTTTETSRLLSYRGSGDPYSVTSEGPDYGAVKVLCEKEAEKQFPARTLIVRPSYIAGPGDTHEALPYWPLRMEHGGEVLAAGDPATPVQFIDVRDMAEWITRMIEKRATGTYNAVGPATATNMRDLVNAARAAVSSPSEVTWVSTSWLSTQSGKEAFGTLLFWESNKGYLTRMSNSRALSQGLTTRPVGVTLADTLQWCHQHSGLSDVRTGYRRKPDGSGWEPLSMPWSAYLEREKAFLAAWHAHA
jgi:2'-hydroxyisoflavone reductase